MSSWTARGMASAAGVFVVAALLVGCNNTDDSAGSRQDPASVASSSAPSIDPKLKVKVPLPTAGLLKNTCSALTPKEAAVVGVKPKGRFDNTVAPSCQWTSSGNDQNLVSLNPQTLNQGGLSDIYSLKAKQKYFIPATVDGYPALYADQIDSRPSGGCVLWVGVTDQLAVAASVDLPVGRNHGNPCPIALKLATAMVGTLKTQL